MTNNSSSQNYPHPDNHTIQTTDTPGFKPFTKWVNLKEMKGRCNINSSVMYIIVSCLPIYLQGSEGKEMEGAIKYLINAIFEF